MWKYVNKFHDWIFFILIWLVLMFFFPKFPGKLINWDNNPTMLLPIALVKDARLSFENLEEGKRKLQVYGSQEDLMYWFVVNGEGRVLSGYPILNGVLLLPSYLIASIFFPNIWDIGSFPNPLLIEIGLVTSVTLTVFTAFVIYRLIILRTGSKWVGLLSAFIFVFGTSVISVSSRTPWQHTFSLFFLSLVLLFFQQKKYVPVILFSVLVALCRPPAVLICLPFVIWTLVGRWRAKILFKFKTEDLIAGIIVIAVLAFQLYYSLSYLNNPLVLAPVYKAELFSGNMLLGLAGLLVSPSKGILIYTPIFLVSILRLIYLYKRKAKSEFWLYSISLGGFFLLTSRWRLWFGGGSIGYRLLLEAVPILIILMADWLASQRWKQDFKLMFVVLAIIASYLMNTQITTNYGDCLFHAYPTIIDDLSPTEQLKRIWLHSPILRCFKDLHRD